MPSSPSRPASRSSCSGGTVNTVDSRSGAGARASKPIQRRAPRFDRFVAQRTAVQLQQVECVIEDRRTRLRRPALLQQLEMRAARRIERNDLPVDQRGAAAQLPQRGHHLGIVAGQRLPVARPEPGRDPVLHAGQRPVTVELDFATPVARRDAVTPSAFIGSTKRGATPVSPPPEAVSGLFFLGELGAPRKELSPPVAIQPSSGPTARTGHGASG